MCRRDCARTDETMNHDELETLLIGKPKDILDRELALIEMTTLQAKDINFAEIIKIGYKIEADMNKSFKNERERKSSVELQLKDNAPYQDFLKRITNREKEIKIAQANLTFQKDLLRSYLAIAGMG